MSRYTVKVREPVLYCLPGADLDCLRKVLDLLLIKNCAEFLEDLISSYVNERGWSR